MFASLPVLSSGQTNIAVSSAKFPTRTASPTSLSGAHKQRLTLLTVLSLEMGEGRMDHLWKQGKTSSVWVSGSRFLRWCCCGTPDKHLVCSRRRSCCVCCSCTEMNSYPQQIQSGTGRLLETRKSRSHSLVRRLARTAQKHCDGRKTNKQKNSIEPSLCV